MFWPELPWGFPLPETIALEELVDWLPVLVDWLPVDEALVVVMC
jgi:hypothetical protein